MAVDALMEAVPPMHWDDLATKGDQARLDERATRTTVLTLAVSTWGLVLAALAFR
jgi:hypothetical protein